MNIRVFTGKKERGRDDLFDHGTIRVILAGCLAIAISLMIMSFLSITITKNAVVVNFKKVVIQYMAGSISAGIDAKIDKAIDASLMLAEDPSVSNWVNSLEQSGIYGAEAKGRMLRLVKEFGYDTTFLASGRTNNYWSSGSGGVSLLYVLSRGNEADSWFYNMLGTKKRYEININYDRELKDTFVWINAVTGPVNSPIAVAGVGMNLSKVVKELIQSSSGNSMGNDIWLVDDQGEICLSKSDRYMNHNLSEYLPEQQKSDILSSGKTSDTLYPMDYTDKDGELYDVVYKKIKDTKWNLVIQIPRSESLEFLNQIIYSTIIACILVIIIIVLMFNILSQKVADPYKRALLINRELESKIEERTKELKEQHVKIQDSIDYAKIIQQTILPSAEELDRIFSRYFVIWEPRDTVGGDFYWVRKFDDGVLIVLGDCTGHGVPGSLMTMAVNAVLNRIVDEECHNDPARILQELDRLLKQNFRREHYNDIISDGLDAGVLFISRECRILYSGAGIPLWVRYGGDIRELRGRGESIGSSRNRRGREYVNTEIGYAGGMALYMATDGLKDQPGGEDRLPYGKRRILSLLSASADGEMREQRNKVMAAFQAYAGMEQRRDDIAMIGIGL